MNAAVVPVKRLGAGKSRLEGWLGPAEREALALAMLGDVLAALRATPEVDRVAVVTPDAAVAEVAEAAGALALRRPDPGLNASVDAAAAALVAAGATSLLVVLGDVAGAAAGDLSALYAALGALGGRGVVLAPSRDGGTAALLRSPPDAIASRFGPESARAHREDARAHGVAFRELALPTLGIDVDHPEDVEALLASDAPAARTRAVLSGRRAGAPP